MSLSLRQFPITDAHVHIWDTHQLGYPWLNDVQALNKSFSFADYEKETSDFQVEQVIFVQAECKPEEYREEVNWVSAQAEKHTKLKGIVAYGPLHLGLAAEPHLAWLAQNPLVKGIRRMYGPGDVNCNDKTYLEALALLEQFGLSFDICIKHPELKANIRMVEKVPGVHYMLDHLGKPGIKDKEIATWKTDISKLANFPNVYCKISGAITEADHAQWTAEDLKPYIAHVLETFGFDRVCFGSDWPVAKLAGGFSKWIGALEETLSGCTNEELQKLFYLNAQRFYKI